MHVEAGTALDAHLAEMKRLRLQLTDARAIEPAERLDVVLQIAISAQRLADVVYSPSSRARRRLDSRAVGVAPVEHTRRSRVAR